MESTEYRARADLHRPTDSAAIAVEIRKLAEQGLKPQDIATALRVNISQVFEALGEQPIATCTSNTRIP